ncbi:hypothetical protein BDP81DRAFT_450559 [Colletotrichum phormii]|uniref:Uncharacterized protein n=1 Tax=Colletotrichum phormii TaxID=359342 RepID=A0AAI9ZQ11_9PEZI|nr:uncharacterized protein BDP81DRAFT_450559 [Colletotrichum phormii]KAK1635706.1 hypothetical protein BDP81DRAFT_450559 [Colletotrichum phormii]
MTLRSLVHDGGFYIETARAHWAAQFTFTPAEYLSGLFQLALRYHFQLTMNSGTTAEAWERVVKGPFSRVTTSQGPPNGVTYGRIARAKLCLNIAALPIPHDRMLCTYVPYTRPGSQQPPYFDYMRDVSGQPEAQSSGSARRQHRERSATNHVIPSQGVD